MGVVVGDTTRKQIDFSMFLMYRLAESWGEPVFRVYRRLEAAGALRNYIIPFYDVLHTLGEEYLVDDVTEYVRERGVFA